MGLYVGLGVGLGDFKWDLVTLGGTRDLRWDLGLKVGLGYFGGT